MRINIYYGGRGVHGDPSLYVVRKMMQVFEELNVKVNKYDLFDQKNNITLLPQSLKEVDGVILASTVEWHGVGGYLTSFLDACWLFGDKEKIAGIYMAPVVMSTTYGEKEAELDLISAWESLGGLVCSGISGYIPEIGELENNKSYQELIEKCAENIYRSINKKMIHLPASTKAISQTVSRTITTLLTQQETEQLSEYISNDKYIKKQKEDIQELTNLFKGKLNLQGKEDISAYTKKFQDRFKPVPELHMNCKIILAGNDKNIVLRVDNAKLEAFIGELAYANIELSMAAEVLDEIVKGNKTFHTGFMEGKVTSKGDFKYLKAMDDLFPFGEK